MSRDRESCESPTITRQDGRFHDLSIRSAAVASVVIVGVLAIMGGTTLDASMQWLVFVIPAMFVVLAGHELYLGTRNGRGLQSLGTFAMSLIGLVAIALPGYQLVKGERESVLTKLQVSAFNPLDGVSKAYVLFILCLCAFAFMESIGFHVTSRTCRRARVEEPRTFLVLISFGLFGVLFLHVGGHSQASLLARGQQHGQGLATVIADCLPTGIVLGVLKHHWSCRLYALISLGALGIFLVLSNTRSAAVFIAVAVALRLILRKRIRVHVIVGLVVTMYVVAVFVVAFDQYRASIVSGQDETLSTAVSQALPDPIWELSAKGSLDTFDGSILALHVDRGAVGATWLDPLKAVVELVPSQVWISKPAFLSDTITKEYSDFGGQSGIFLSGPGYCYVAFDGFIGAGLAFALLGLMAGAGWRYFRNRPFWASFVAYFLVRFIVAGDAFDGLYLFTLVLGVVLARCAAVVFLPRMGFPEMGTSRQ